MISRQVVDFADLARDNRTSVSEALGAMPH
jgi:hypothetical protein